MLRLNLNKIDFLNGSSNLKISTQSGRCRENGEICCEKSKRGSG